MSRKRQLVKIINKKIQRISKNLLSVLNKRVVWLLRTILITKPRKSSANAGFVLPTVAMVTVVVVLLSTAILFRSFERAKNASNVRVNQAVLAAATPALDRARAKIEELMQDPTLPRGTPTDRALYDTLNKSKYSLGDETRLKMAFDIDGDGSIESGGSIEDEETLRTAWKFAVDTDNNGKKDTFTLYGINFRTPTIQRERSPLEARTPPMDNGLTNTQCRSATGFSSLVGSSGWYKLQSGNLGKSFFVYAVNVPITNLENLSNTEYEVYKGNKSIVALELQQDRTRVPLPNNAVWSENDLEIITGTTALLLNGRIHTNGNLLVGVIDDGSMTFRQVSSKTSCFYTQENGLITVGGNVGNGSIGQVNNSTSVTVDMYRGYGNNVTNKSINSTNKSTNQSGGANIGFNDAAFNQRIAAMMNTAIGLCSSCQTATSGSELKSAVTASSYPEDLKNNVADKVKDSDDGEAARNILSEEIEIYLRNRTRRVPFAEVSDATGTGATSGYTAITANLEPPAAWRQPLNGSNQFTNASSVTVNTSQLLATFPDLQKQEGVQTELGDRVLVGNNLPALWKKGTEYVGSETKNEITGVNWTRPTGADAEQRWRNTQIQAISDLGISQRNGFWEEKAAENPVNDLDGVGGVRIITGAGIYVDDPDVDGTTTDAFYDRSTYSFLPDAPDPDPLDNTDIRVWPDTMPMSDPAYLGKQGDLLMRATAVYHYKVNHGRDQTPIACVSSYYDPSNATTAKNKINIDVGYGVDTTNGKSNNGIVYPFPGRSTFATYKALLERQGKLRFPNGRWANEPLKTALAKIGTATTVPATLQLADYSAIDTALCAISILNNPNNFVTTPTNQPKHGAIKEAAFLDARETKQISTSSTAPTYDLDLEQRQPLEIRVTDIDLGTTNGITNTAITADEYLLPYSGIIYASRDDALRDESDKTSQSQLLSPTDFKLDPTRRPNGIRLVNGGTLARTSNNAYNPKEKGLILVTDLPAYIKGNFNLHRTTTSSTTEIEEFTQTEPGTNFYDRSTPNTNFACRRGRPGCPTGGNGDYWRPATIIADSMTLLSSNFKDGVRSQGDYDLNNNTGEVAAQTDRLEKGFWENNFATSTNWWGNDNYPNLNNVGSYTVNGVTPIQRRVNGHPMYVMEMCRKLVVSECAADRWVVGFDSNGDGDLEDTVTLNGISTLEKDIKANQLVEQINDSNRGRLGAGDTGGQALLEEDRRYPRRVAFARDSSNRLVPDANGLYKPLGIGCPLNGCTYGTNYGQIGNNALWFRTTNSTTNPGDIAQAVYASDKPLFYYPPADQFGQPRLVPVLQIHDAMGSPPNLRPDRSSVRNSEDFRDKWLQPATSTTFNATFVLGSSPSRAAEISSGLNNFVRFLENWDGDTAKISGSFIQLQRSAFATGPLAPIFTARSTTTSTNTNNLSLFDYALDTYPTQNADGLLPHYWPPSRKWGFDVAVLSEQPDLFAQRFTAPPTGRPNEFLREVTRDDDWVKTLLCAGEPASGGAYSNAVPNEYRPSSCPSIPND